MIAVIASFFSLFVGPLVYQTFGPLRRTDKIVASIVLVIVVGTVVFEVIPSTSENLGLLSIGFALLGFGGPTLIEKTFQQAADTTHKLTLFLGLLGLIVHAFIDGVMLAASQNTETNGLSLAIILHRLPVGLTIWWLLKPLLGERYALLTLLMMGVATVFGSLSSEIVVSYENNTFFAAMQALIAGSLLHVVIHKPHADGCLHTSHDHDLHHHHHQSGKNQLKDRILSWEAFGMLIGTIIFLVVHQYHS